MGLTAARKALYGIGTALALLGLTEGAIRALPRSEAKPKESPVDFVGNDLHGRFPTALDDDCFWRIPPSSPIPDLTPPESVNTHGFRGPEFAAKKPAGARRFVLLGDSNTFGMGVEGDEYYAHILRRWLSLRKDVKWDVVNCAIPGYSVLQMLQMFRTVAKDYGPDLVGIYAGAWNDFTPAMGLDDVQAHAAIQRARASREGLSIQRMQLFRQFREWFEQPAPPVETDKKDRYRKLWENGERPEGPRLTEVQFRGILTTLCREIRASGAKAVVFVPPAPFKTRERWKDSERYAALVREVAKAEADFTVDSRADLTLPEEWDKQLFCDVIHPSYLGHMAIASRLTRTLTQGKVEGLPDRAFEFEKEPPVSLKSRQASAIHELGDPPERIDTQAALSIDATSIVIPAPHRITFPDVPIPMMATLYVELGFFTRKDFTGPEIATKPAKKEIVGPLTFEVRVVKGTEPAQFVFRQDRSSPNDNLWSPLTEHRIDLSAYGGETVTIILECKGTVAVRTFWGAAVIYPYR